jgi:hypothetical protein
VSEELKREKEDCSHVYIWNLLDTDVVVSCITFVIVVKMVNLCSMSRTKSSPKMPFGHY